MVVSLSSSGTAGRLLFAPGTDEAALMDAAIEAGADDVLTNDDGSVEVITAASDYMAVKDALAAAGFKAEYRRRHDEGRERNTRLAGDEALRMQKLIDALDSLDDVQEVYTSVVKGGITNDEKSDQFRRIPLAPDVPVGDKPEQV
jgi:transcriptional/translational regulatory protein YebC/TACO1